VDTDGAAVHCLGAAACGGRHEPALVVWSAQWGGRICPRTRPGGVPDVWYDVTVQRPDGHGLG